MPGAKAILCVLLFAVYYVLGTISVFPYIAVQFMSYNLGVKFMMVGVANLVVILLSVFSARATTDFVVYLQERKKA